MTININHSLSWFQRCLLRSAFSKRIQILFSLTDDVIFFSYISFGICCSSKENDLLYRLREAQPCCDKKFSYFSNICSTISLNSLIRRFSCTSSLKWFLHQRTSINHTTIDDWTTISRWGTWGWNIPWSVFGTTWTWTSSPRAFWVIGNWSHSHGWPRCLEHLKGMNTGTWKGLIRKNIFLLKCV